MSPPVIYLAITNHGFGHAVRISSVAAKLKQINPEVVLIIATTAPHWLLESYIEADFIHRVRGFDIGVIQSDSLNMDIRATHQKLKQIQKDQKQTIDSEATFLRTNRVNLILGDIPPLIAPIAKAAGIPCWMMSNFGWDYIYQAWGEEFQETVNWIKDCYSQTDHLLRLPMCEPMDSFPVVTDVGLTGGDPKYSLLHLKEKFNLNAPPERTILMTFGGLGLQAIPYHNLEYLPDWQLITFDSGAPKLPNLRYISDHKYRPVDFMPLCGKVVSKPGYSTFAEALRLEVPLVSLTRSGFAETPLLLEGIQNYGQHQIIDNQEFFRGKWEFLRDDPLEPRQDKKLLKNGSEDIAMKILKELE